MVLRFLKTTVHFLHFGVSLRGCVTVHHGLYYADVQNLRCTVSGVVFNIIKWMLKWPIWRGKWQCNFKCALSAFSTRSFALFLSCSLSRSLSRILLIYPSSVIDPQDWLRCSPGHSGRMVEISQDALGLHISFYAAGTSRVQEAESNSSSWLMCSAAGPQSAFIFPATCRSQG